MDEQEEHKCRNCKYFIKHYMNLHGRFMPLLYGHCIHREVPRHISNKLIDKDKVCEKWEPMSLQTEKRREHIKNMLISMAENINDIAQILNDENKVE